MNELKLLALQKRAICPITDCKRYTKNRNHWRDQFHRRDLAFIKRMMRNVARYLNSEVVKHNELELTAYLQQTSELL